MGDSIDLLASEVPGVECNPLVIEFWMLESELTDLNPMRRITIPEKRLASQRRQQRRLANRPLPNEQHLRLVLRHALLDPTSGYDYNVFIANHHEPAAKRMGTEAFSVRADTKKVKQHCAKCEEELGAVNITCTWCELSFCQPCSKQAEYIIIEFS